MNALERHEANLDQAYNQLLESREADLLRREMLEDRILNDENLFCHLALIYARESMNEPCPLGFMDFATERLIREEEPEYTGGWEERPSNAEYWNWNDDRI